MNNLEWKRCSTMTSESKSSTAPVIGIAALVPPFLRSFCQNPHSIEMHVSYDAPTHQTTYRYTIIWDDELGTEEMYKKLLENHIPKPRPSPPAPVSALCDGPCHRFFPSNRLHAIGRCGHYLCEACNGIVQNSDGSNGCSSLQCNYNGKNRREARRNFEKEVCQKQRAHALDLKAKGFPVVPASAMSSRSSSANNSKESDSEEASSEPSSKAIPKAAKPSEQEKPARKRGTIMRSMSRVVSRSSSVGRFKLVYPKQRELIGMKLVIVEPAEGFGIYHTSGRLEAMSSTKLRKAIAHLLQKRNRNPNMAGDLYYAELQPDYTRRLRKVDMTRFDEVQLYEFPMIADYVVFVLDMGEFVKSGVSVFYS